MVPTVDVVVAAGLCEVFVVVELDAAELFVAVAEHFVAEEPQEDAVVELEPTWLDQPMSRGVLR